MNYNPGWADMIRAHAGEQAHLLSEMEDGYVTTIIAIAGRMVDVYRNGGKAIIFGNGGSYADAIHFAGELEGAYRNRNRPALPALVPSNPAALTAIANDFGYEHVFRKFVEANVQQGDIVIGISTSGESPNVVLGLEEARKKKSTTVAFTGSTGGKMANHADILLRVPSDDTPRIQGSHHFVFHEICDIVERELFPQGD